ncbi:hypothetical protein M0R89_19600 (plasmid) [Halorussus limi]|uniref:Uncharacterized protein n=1 Tax=Halorussus limi TaxID=2938695 RepID=A0A8U0HZL6_9EURY|nr:hypothetical protein [Halorussus limi]UPV76367.1 hypothetical protein M0R89_19600 [Halorussus limi]
MTDDRTHRSPSPSSERSSPPRWRSRTPASATRRGFLALAGATALAGCSDFGDVLNREDGGPTLDGATLRDVVASDSPSVPETVPVEIPRSDIDSGLARARDLLGSVPASLDAEAIPNGAIRRRLARNRDEAEKSIDAVSEAASPLEAIDRLGDARESARSVAAAWRAIDGDLAPEDLRRSAEDIWVALNRFRYAWDYLGTDPVRALVVHATVEGRLRTATGSAERVVGRGRPTPDDPLAVGELAGRLEVARAAMDDMATLYDPIRKSGDTRTFRSGFVRAVDALEAVIDARRRRLPDADPRTPSAYVDGNVEGTPVGHAIGDLAEELTHHDDFERERRTDDYATTILAGHGTLARLRALESLRQRVAADEHVTVESVADVRTLRRRAVDAIEAVRERDEHPHLNRRELAAIDEFVSYADEELVRSASDDSVDVNSIARELGNYVRAAAVARELPQASADAAKIVRRSVREVADG